MIIVHLSANCGNSSFTTAEHAIKRVHLLQLMNNSRVFMEDALSGCTSPVNPTHTG